MASVSEYEKFMAKHRNKMAKVEADMRREKKEQADMMEELMKQGDKTRLDKIKKRLRKEKEEAQKKERQDMERRLKEIEMDGEEFEREQMGEEDERMRQILTNEEMIRRSKAKRKAGEEAYKRSKMGRGRGEPLGVPKFYKLSQQNIGASIYKPVSSALSDYRKMIKQGIPPSRMSGGRYGGQRGQEVSWDKPRKGASRQKEVMKLATSLRAEGMSNSDALREAWAMVKKA